MYLNMKLDKQKSNLKYYYQTQDYKIHAYKNIPEFLDKYVSEIALQKFFEERILFGCEYKKNFIEVIYEEKKLRVSINKKEKFVDFQDPKELKDLFDRESSRMLNSQKTKVRMSKTTILFIAGLILIVVNFITFFISLHFLDKKSIDRLVAPIFLMLFGCGSLMTFPKNLKDFESAEGSSFFDLKLCIISLIFGIMLLLAGFWMLL